MKICFTILLVILTLAGYSINDENLKNRFLKYGSGYYIGDVLIIKMIKNDSIYADNKVIAILIDKVKTIDGSIKITVKSVQSDSLRYYYEK